jgi:acyl-CoA hydrolase
MKYVSPSEAVGLIDSGDSIYIHGSTSIPEVLSQALADRGNELKDVTI